MSRKLFFDTVEDSNQRVRSTIILHKQEGPCWVSNVHGMHTRPVADVSILPAGRDQGQLRGVPFTSEFFQVRKLPSLGYVNSQGAAFYLTRTPSRQTKQGYCRENVVIPQLPEYRTPSWGTLTESRALLDMFLNKYKPFKEVFEEVTHSQDPMMKAFAKTFALSTDDIESIVLWHRGIKVAQCNNHRKYGPLFSLPPRYSYLAEELQENGIRLEAA